MFLGFAIVNIVFFLLHMFLLSFLFYYIFLFFFAIAVCFSTFWFVLLNYYTICYMTICFLFFSQHFTIQVLFYSLGATTSSTASGSPWTKWCDAEFLSPGQAVSAYIFGSGRFLLIATIKKMGSAKKSTEIARSGSVARLKGRTLQFSVPLVSCLTMDIVQRQGIVYMFGVLNLVCILLLHCYKDRVVLL